MLYRNISIVFLILWIVSSGGLCLYEIQTAMMSDDPSAMAVFGFLPLIWPLFFILTGMYLLPTYLVALVIAYFYRR